MLLVDCSFLLTIHWACKAEKSTECRGACVCGCRNAAAPTVRAPPFFRNADAWSGIGGGGGAAVRLADDPASPPQVNTVDGRRIRTALCVNFRQGLTALHVRHGTTARTYPDPDTPPPIASTETTGHP